MPAYLFSKQPGSASMRAGVSPTLSSALTRPFTAPNGNAVPNGIAGGWGTNYRVQGAGVPASDASNLPHLAGGAPGVTPGMLSVIGGKEIAKWPGMPQPVTGGVQSGGLQTNYGAGFGGPSNIQTSITPQDVFSSQQTNAARNQAVALELGQAGDMNGALKQFDRPGVSRSAGSYASAMPELAGHKLNAANAAAQIPFYDSVANSQNNLQGQIGREDEALGWAGIGNQYDQMNNRNVLSILQQLGIGF